MTAFLLLSSLALLGHAFLWIGLVNRLHSVGMRRRTMKLLTLGLFLCAAAIPVGVGAWWHVHNLERPATAAWQWKWQWEWEWTAGADGASTLIAAYAVLCWTVAATTLLRLVYLRCFRLRRPSIVRFHGRRRVHLDLAAVAAAEGENSRHFLVHFPWNEILRLEVSNWTLDVPRLPPALDGFSIVHLSDFHMTGRVGKAYFRQLARASNELQPDLVALTGDLVDAPACLDWIADTLGHLTAKHGVYFVLGNHDLRVGDTEKVRRAFRQCGWIDLGGREHRIEIAGRSVVLAGNERPWIAGPVARPSQRGDADGLRIALAHSPDQIGWARAWDADLMLAGHTHGGQIRIPPLGAVFSPTRRGVKYVAGVFHLPPTILHVSRGALGDIPVRWNCPPEISRLRLQAFTACKALGTRRAPNT